MALACSAFALTAPLAQGFHYRTTALLSEIDSYYSRLEDPEEVKSVYLEWVVRSFPAAWQPYLLQELRHGWRGLRSWITGAWGLGALVALAASGNETQAFSSGLALGGGALLLVGGVGIRLADSDPAWLDSTLPLNRSLRWRARFVVLFFWLQGVVLLPPWALGLRHGLSAALLLFALLEVGALVLALLGTGASQWRSAGWVAYLPAGLLLWAVSLGVLI
jgi:hypothetical protein